MRNDFIIGGGSANLDPIEAAMVAGCRGGPVDVIGDTIKAVKALTLCIHGWTPEREKEKRARFRKEQMVAGLGLMTFGWDDGGAVKLPHDFVAAFRADLGLGPRPAEEDDGAYRFFEALRVTALKLPSEEAAQSGSEDDGA